MCSYLIYSVYAMQCKSASLFLLSNRFLKIFRFYSYHGLRHGDGGLGLHIARSPYQILAHLSGFSSHPVEGEVLVPQMARTPQWRSQTSSSTWAHLGHSSNSPTPKALNYRGLSFSNRGLAPAGPPLATPLVLPLLKPCIRPCV